MCDLTYDVITCRFWTTLYSKIYCASAVSRDLSITGAYGAIFFTTNCLLIMLINGSVSVNMPPS